MEVGSGELLMDGLQQHVVVLAHGCSSAGASSRRGRSDAGRRVELGAVGEAEGRAVDEAVQSDQRQRDGDDAPQGEPAGGEQRDVRNHAEQRLRRPERKQGHQVMSLGSGAQTIICFTSGSV